MIVTLQNGTTYAPKTIFFHRVLFWDYVVFDGGLIMIRANKVYKIENERKGDATL